MSIEIRMLIFFFFFLGVINRIQPAYTITIDCGALLPAAFTTSGPVSAPF